MLQNKKVSIISPCYNGEHFLPLFLNSIISQTYKNIELIIINDGSTDDTVNIVNQYIPKFKSNGMELIAFTQTNKGQAAAINLGLKHFTGEYMMWMDSDDYLMPEAIQKKVYNLENNHNIDFNLCKGMVVNETDFEKQIDSLYRKKTDIDNLFLDLIIERNVVFGPGSIFIRSTSLKKVLPTLNIFESREGQNWQLMLPIAYSLKYDYIDDFLFKYIIHNNSHSHKTKSYEEQIIRRNNFIILVNNTIDNINEMTKEEKEKWKNISYLHHSYVKLKLATKYSKKEDYKKLKKELKSKKVKLLLKDNYTINQVYIRLKRFIKRILKNDKNR